MMPQTHYAPPIMPKSSYSHEDDEDEDDDDDGDDEEEEELSTSHSPPQPAGNTTTLTNPAPTLTKRKRGTGVALLHRKLQERNNTLSRNAKDLLSTLLKEHALLDDHDINSQKEEEKITRETTTTTTKTSPHNRVHIVIPPRKKVRKPIETSMCSDERIMQLAQEGELSFLASLLKVIEEEGGSSSSVTTKFLIKACCLSVEPARVPPLCDAKEMVMAALHFLSQPFVPTAVKTNDMDDEDESASDDFIYPKLPLIRPVSQVSDLERRAYQKAGGEWTLADILPQVLALEEIFYHSCWESKWMAREHSCPNLASGRDLLLLKGSPPAFCTAKLKKIPGERATAAGGATGTGRGRKSAKAMAAAAAAAAAEASRQQQQKQQQQQQAQHSKSSMSAVEEEAQRIINSTMSSDGGSTHNNRFDDGAPATDDNDVDFD